MPLQQTVATQTESNVCVSLQMKELLSTVPESQRAGLVCDLMQYLAPPAISVPHDYIDQSLVSMQRLKEAGRSNILSSYEYIGMQL